MTAQVYTQAEVDALLEAVKSAPGAVGPAGPAGPAGANGAQGIPGPVGPAGPAGANIVLSKTAPVNAPDGTIWVQVA